MKVAITAKGTTLDSELDPRFGRAPFILIIESDSLDCEALDNSANVNAFQGAGIQAAVAISDKGAKVLMTGYCGPKAFATLKAAGIKVIDEMSGSVRDALAALAAGKVRYAAHASKEAHW